MSRQCLRYVTAIVSEVEAFVSVVSSELRWRLQPHSTSAHRIPIRPQVRCRFEARTRPIRRRSRQLPRIPLCPTPDGDVSRDVWSAAAHEEAGAAQEAGAPAGTPGTVTAEGYSNAREQRHLDHGELPLYFTAPHAPDDRACLPSSQTRQICPIESSQS
jgi:hypothetical protein